MIGARRIRPAVHGTRSKYDSGCRCVPCTEANRDYLREWRLKRGVAVSMEVRRGIDRTRRARARQREESA